MPFQVILDPLSDRKTLGKAQEIVTPFLPKTPAYYAHTHNKETPPLKASLLRAKLHTSLKRGCRAPQTIVSLLFDQNSITNFS